MSKPKLQDIVAYIKKQAESLGPPPADAIVGGPMSTGGPPAGPPARGGGYGGNMSIITMQHALQDLAQAVASQINLKDVASGDPKKEQEAKARDAFGVFLTKNYMRNTKVPGVEYDPNPAVTDVSQKRPDDPTRMSIVMDTMNRVGNPKKGENFADGNWGPRTNAAIRNAYAFASGLLDFVDDINRFAQKKMQIRSYNRQELSGLEKYATPDNSLSAQQKIEGAPVVTKHAKAIKAMYDEVKANVLQKPAYQQFIEGSVPFKTYQPVVTQQMVDSLKKNFTDGISFTLPNVGQQKISVDSLLNLDALKAWIQQTFQDPAQQAAVTPESVVSAIWKQNGGLLGADPGY